MSKRKLTDQRDFPVPCLQCGAETVNKSSICSGCLRVGGYTPSGPAINYDRIVGRPSKYYRKRRKGDYALPLDTGEAKPGYSHHDDDPDSQREYDGDQWGGR